MPIVKECKRCYGRKHIGILNIGTVKEQKIPCPKCSSSEHKTDKDVKKDEKTA